MYYSTNLSPKIVQTFTFWHNSLRNYKKGHIKRAQAFLSLAHACEQEHKDPMKVYDELMGKN